MKSSLYQDLQTPQASASFLCMLKDYMEYLRSDSRRVTDGSWNESDQQDLTQAFIAMVHSDIAWLLAKQAVPEFRSKT